MDPKTALDALGQETLDNIAQALWLPAFDAALVPPEILERLVSDKNSNKAFGERTRTRLRDLIAHPTTFTPSYRARYEAFLQYLDALTPHQAHVLGNLMGPDFDYGFKEIPDTVQLQFPQDHRADLTSAVGWYYIVGSCTGENDVEYGVLMMLFRVSLLPPAQAQSFGLSDLENQVVDFQLAINRGGDAHYQAVPVCLAGTTGLVQYSNNPFLAVYGKNEMRSLSNDDLFPLQVRARGWDRGKNPPVELEIDFLFTSGKGILLQGNNGVLSIGGIGTPYYSIPNLVLDPAKSRIRLGGEEIALKEGQFWLDHQWGVLGSPRVEVVRAAMNLAPPSPGGWDWFELQFEGDRQISVVGMHSHDNLPFYHQEGPTPPGTMTAQVSGKYMSEKGETSNATGTLRVTDWIQNGETPDPNQYWGTKTWHPNRWEFHFDPPVPDELRNVILVPLNPRGSLLFFNAGEQYQEAPVHILNPAGIRIGRGFAESVQYANTNENRLKLAGLPDTPAMLALLQAPAPTLFSKMWSVVDVLAHKDELARAMSGTPKKT